TQEQGFVDDYQGIRIATTGERFLIERAIVWNVLNDQGQQVGQAAAFDHWQRLVDRA
ncbi:MAG: MEKHLA domain-containing protein, partial [Planctomycetota bacterium]|nr:MEKHLA domain-containing protein [Planctomycetota bacterium]